MLTIAITIMTDIHDFLLRDLSHRLTPVRVAEDRDRRDKGCQVGSDIGSIGGYIGGGLVGNLSKIVSSSVYDIPTQAR